MRKDFYLYKRGKVWYVQFRLPGGDIGVARSSGHTNKTAAERWAREELPKTGSSRDSLYDWAEQFFIDECPHVTRLKTEGKPFSDQHKINSRKLLVSDVLPDPICQKVMADLTRADVLAFRDRLVARRGACRTSQRVMGVLRLVLREALFRELLGRDLFAGVGQIAYEKKVRSALPVEQLSPVFDPKAYSNRLHYEATVCAALTGLRAGEVRGLQWGDLGDVISVRRSIATHGDEVSLPKWGKVRTCPYPKTLRAILEPRRGAPGEWVFSLREGGPLGYREWAGAVRRLKVPGLSLHRLRHTLNTVLRSAGVSDELLRGSFGWADQDMQENYTHRALYNYAPQADAVDRILGGMANEAGSD